MHTPRWPAIVHTLLSVTFFTTCWRTSALFSAPLRKGTRTSIVPCTTHHSQLLASFSQFLAQALLRLPSASGSQTNHTFAISETALDIIPCRTDFVQKLVLNISRFIAYHERSTKGHVSHLQLVTTSSPSVGQTASEQRSEFLVLSTKLSFHHN